MCGIAGIIDFGHGSSEKTLGSMTAALHHRGPDNASCSFHTDAAAQIGLGHARLSILDLSPAGNQPMHYKSLSIVFNGEIYNFRELRKELESEGHTFVSNSDTEVILHAFEAWGVACVHRFIGMFAFLLHDRQAGKIYGFRDRAGVKPFFYYHHDNLFLFASELKAFHKHPRFRKEINIQALYAYFDFGYVPSPHSIFEHTYKVQPGHYFCFDLEKRALSFHRYWNVDDGYFRPKLDISYPEARQHLSTILESAFRYRLVSDVPVGIFLSGGYDSTAVTAILQKNTGQKLKTFTIGFSEGNNEAPYARRVAEHLGTDHYEHYCTDQEVRDIIYDLPVIYDEPFADSSAIPTILVSRFARQQITVALSADAGDEIFAGYKTYRALYRKFRHIQRVPHFLRTPAGMATRALQHALPGSKATLKHKLESFSKLMLTPEHEAGMALLRKYYRLPEQYRDRFIRRKNEALRTRYDDDPSHYHHFMDMLCASGYKSFLENDLMTKVDRATMSVSLEGREPFLDHRIIEFVSQLPISYKFNKTTSKRILRDIVHDHVPREMMDRPKAGFTIPIHRSLQNGLDFFLDDYLSPEKLSKSELFHHDFLNENVKRFRAKKFPYKPFIWKLLVFQMWYEKWME